MSFPKRFKYIWWGLLSACGVYLLWTRYSKIKSGTLGSFDTVLLASVAGLLILPFFSEISVLGITLKQQIESFKKDVKEEIQGLKLQLTNSNDLSNNLSQQIIFGNLNPPPDSQLGIIETRVRSILQQTLREMGVMAEASEQLVTVPESNQFMFSVRFQIEKELMRLWRQRLENNEPHFRTLQLVLKDLVNHGVIPPGLFKVIKEVITVCNAGIHGNEPTENQVEFIRKVGPELVSTLRAIV